jgi:hypothetical protein
MSITLSIIILNWNTRDLLAQCLDTLAQHVGTLSHEIVVVDNASSDGSAAMVQARYPHVRLIQNTGNVGFAAGNNCGMRASSGRYMLLLNTDAFVTPGALQGLMQLAEAQPRAGIVGAHLRNADGSFQASHTRFPNLWQEFLILSGLGRALHGPFYPSHGPDGVEHGAQHDAKCVDYVEGACLLVRREAFEQAGGLDEGFFMYAEEVDWCKTMQRAGWEVWYAPHVRITHLGGGSSKTRKTAREADLYRSRVRYFRKHHGPVAALALKGLIYGSVMVKQVVHGALRALSGGKRGRHVTTLQQLKGL